MNNFVKLDASDAGCWIAGSWGKYAMPRLLEIAEEYGWSPKEPLVDESDEYYLEMLCDLCDEAEDWLNDNVTPEGYEFGWQDGEFFLWTTMEWDMTMGLDFLLDRVERGR